MRFKYPANDDSWLTEARRRYLFGDRRRELLRYGSDGGGGIRLNLRVSARAAVSHLYPDGAAEERELATRVLKAPVLLA